MKGPSGPGPFGLGVGVAVMGATLAGCEPAERTDSPELTGPPPWAVEREVTVGSIDGPDDALSHVDNVLLGPEGALYVVLDREHEIWVFGPDGERTGTIGGQGAGPEEFGWLGAVAAVGDTIYVSDHHNARLNLISWDGEFFEARSWDWEVSRIPWDDGRGAYELPAPRDLGVGPGDRLVISPGQSARPDDPGEGEPGVRTSRRADPYFLVNERRELVDTVAFRDHEGTTVTLPHDGDLYRFISPFTDAPLSAVLPDGAGVVAVERRRAPAGADSAAFRVHMIDATGDTTVSRTHPYRPREATHEAVRARLEETSVGPADFLNPPADPNPPGPEEMEAYLRDEGHLPENLAPVTEVTVGQDGSIWLRREDTGADSLRWNVLDREGELRGEVLLPWEERVAAARDPFLATTMEGDLDVPYVTRYRIVRQDAATSDPPSHNTGSSPS